MVSALYVDGMSRRVTAAELWSDVSFESPEELCREDVWCENLDVIAPERKLELGEGAVGIALDLADILEGATLHACEGECHGHIVIFSDGRERGLPTASDCCVALGIKEKFVSEELRTDIQDLHGGSSVEAEDYASKLECGFCYDPGDDVPTDKTQGKIVEMTIRMESDLTDHFVFHISDEACCAPVLYGGRHGTAIVAVYGGRVWT